MRDGQRYHRAADACDSPLRRPAQLAAALAAAALALALTAAMAGADDPTVPGLPDAGLPIPSQANPYTDMGDQLSNLTGQDVNTDLTPRAADKAYGEQNSQLFQQVAGARYGEQDVRAGSVTSYDDNLYTVSLENTKSGLAGGQRALQCRRPDGSSKTVEVPVAYRYHQTSDRGVVWDKVDLPGADCEHPGFIGAIAWIRATGAAVAVGGTGSYPEREPAYGQDIDGNPCPPDPSKPYGWNCDQARMARAWLYCAEKNAEVGCDAEGWRDLTAELPQGMHGLTALDFHPLRDLGFAGGLGQLWEWKANRFTGKRYDKDSPTPPANAASADPSKAYFGSDKTRFLFRVRDIRAIPPPEDNHGPGFYAVTDGCCAGIDPSRGPQAGTSASLGEIHDTPEMLGYSDGNWYSNTVDTTYTYGGMADNAVPLGPRFWTDALGLGGHEPWRLNARPDMPDSLYSLLVGQFRGGTAHPVAVLASPGGCEGCYSSEPSSVLTQPYCPDQTGAPVFTDFKNEVPDQAIESLHMNLSSARLVAADGDSASSFSLYTSSGDNAPAWGLEGGPSDVRNSAVGCDDRKNFVDPNKGDGVPDWAAGALRSSDKGEGPRGLLLPTFLRPSLAPEAIDTTPLGKPKGGAPDPSKLTSGYSPTTQDKLRAYLRSQYLLSPSYALNAIDIVDPLGVGFAVGEHGAIVHIGSGASGGLGTTRPEPEPPALGARAAGSAPATSAFAPLRPAPGRPGEIPPLSERPLETLAASRLIAEGSPQPAGTPPGDPPEDVAQIVMSRDGSEGWALGPSRELQGSQSGGVLSLSHFDGERWTRCDSAGVAGLVAPDPACAAIAPLRDYLGPDGRSAPVKIWAAARIPYENDSDPSNDDEFEIVAVGSLYREGTAPEKPVVLRYRDGSWRVELDNPLRDLTLSGSSTIAFTAPDDGWVLTPDPFSTDPTRAYLYHFDGKSWTACPLDRTAGAAQRASCADPDGRLALKASPDTGDHGGFTGLASAGRRGFLYGERDLSGRSYPLILSYEHGRGWSRAAPDGGFDPAGDARAGGPAPPPSEQGSVAAVSVTPRAGDAYSGWAVGQFRRDSLETPAVVNPAPTLGLPSTLVSPEPVAPLPPATALMRLAGGGWSAYPDDGPLHDSLVPASTGGDPPATRPALMAVLPEGGAFIAQLATGRLFGFDGRSGRWGLVAPERPTAHPPDTGPRHEFAGTLDGPIQALAPDGRGGLWAAVGGDGHDDFFHYTDRTPEPVFGESASPLRSTDQRFTGMAGAADGTVWATTESATLYRYDRLLGWDRIDVPGWDPRRATVAAEANAVAMNAGGAGVVVGRQGRIADIESGTVKLDDAAGTLCDLANVAPPCGTGRELEAAAVAPDGSAIVGGQSLSLLWRPAGGAFRAIERPAAPSTATVTALSMPQPGEAWLATQFGTIYHGSEQDGHWSWQPDPEDLSARGDLLALDESRSPLAITALALDAQGHGYAVGDRGLVLERTGTDGEPWRRLETGSLDDLTAVALPAGGGPGALLGGRNGVMLTESGGRLRVARPADHSSALGEYTGPVVGLALVPGAADGEVEAWAATAAPDLAKTKELFQNISQSQLFHYASSDDPLLNPGGRAQPLPDAPAPRPGEIAFAAFGKTECHLPEPQRCPELNEGTDDYDVTLRRVLDEIKARAGSQDGLALALFTGDAVDSASTHGYGALERQAQLGAGPQLGVGGRSPDVDQLNGPRKLRRWREQVAEPLEAAGVPVFGAIGGQDLGEARSCPAFTTCASNRTVAKAGDNLAWRVNLAAEPGPWGTAKPWGEGHAPSDGRFALQALDQGSDSAITVADPSADAPDGEGGSRHVGAQLNGARTHYALELTERATARPVARFVVVDSSLLSLMAGDPVQNPVERDGQQQWLQRMVCFAGQGDGCTRRRDEQAIVVSNAPTYSYAPTPSTELATDATQFESLLMREHVNLVVSGRLGWNGLYWATAPGVHEPCPGDPYRTTPPQPGARVCGQAADASLAPGAGGVAALLRGLGAPPAPTGDPTAATGLSQSGVLPFVVASSAGGKFGDDGLGTAAQGFWHGYTIVRLAASGDPRETIVEQRPIFDWIQILGQDHTLRPGQHLTLHGVGREPLGYSTSSPIARHVTTRYDGVDSPAITHRYDLLEADPERPYLAKVVEGDGNPHGYVPLDPSIATIDPQSGKVVTGRGNHGRVYALAILSVADKAASYPLVFEPKRSYVAPKPSLIAPPLVPQIRVLGLNAQALQAPPSATPPSTPPPLTTNLSLPAPPALPTFPSAAPPPSAPPAPPAPPPPPPAQQAVPLNLSVTPVGIAVPPTPGVTAQPTPPVQPAPPSGARREAKQRQAATAKSEESARVSEVREQGGDLANAPESSNQYMTRRDRVRASADGFTPLARPRAQPSAWVTGLEWGGGVGLAALALALGFATVRPTPRRRPPELPAPAWSRARRRP